MDYIAHQAPLDMGFSRQEYCSGLLCSPLVNLLDPGMEPRSLDVSYIGRRVLYATWEAHLYTYLFIIKVISWFHNFIYWVIILCCSVTKSCPTLGDPMNCSMPGFSVFHYVPEFAQTLVP